METPLLANTPAVAPEGEQVEAHDVNRLGSATNDLMGPVVVGGNAGADCFRWTSHVQAGITDPYAYGKDKFGPDDGDMDDQHPDLRPW